MGRPSKDDMLIKQNPKKSPAQLREMGLSELRYEELLSEAKASVSDNPYDVQPQPAKPAEVKAKVQPEPQPVVETKPKAPEKVTVIRATPKTRPLNMPAGDMAYLVSPTGKMTRMSTATAQRYAAKWKGYKVV